MRAVKILAVVLLGAVALLGAGLFALGRYLDSEAFRRAAIGAAQEALGAPVTVGQLDVSLFSGAVLRQVTVGSPPGLPGEILRAEALVVRPRFLPLLRRRLEIAEIRLDAPIVTLTRSAGGEWSFERLAARTGAAPPAGPAAPSAPLPLPAPAALDVIVPRLGISRGTLLVTRDRNEPLVAAEGVELGTSLSRVGGAVTGQGQLTVASLRVANRVEVRELAAPLRFGAGELTLAPVSGQLADGTLGGQATVRLARDGTRSTSSCGTRGPRRSWPRSGAETSAGASRRRRPSRERPKAPPARVTPRSAMDSSRTSPCSAPSRRL